VRADQCHALPAEMDDALGAMIEPFAVALHAVKRAGVISGKRVLVAGGGPIGLLVAMTARTFGAAPVALSDIVAARRETAQKLGADIMIDPSAKTWRSRFVRLPVTALMSSRGFRCATGIAAGI